MKEQHLTDLSEMTKVELLTLKEIIKDKKEEADIASKIWLEELDAVELALASFGSDSTVH